MWNHVTADAPDAPRRRSGRGRLERSCAGCRYDGRACFAREACSTCHVVEAEQRAPRHIIIGPAFRDIANTPGITSTALRAFSTTSHPKMPNLILTPKKTADVIAYILASAANPPPDRVLTLPIAVFFLACLTSSVRGRRRTRPWLSASLSPDQIAAPALAYRPMPRRWMLEASHDRRYRPSGRVTDG
jgi:mono/diheme cytochrome c family protein